MTLPLTHAGARPRTRPAGLVLLWRWGPLVLGLLFAIGSVLFWLNVNVTPYGRDAGGHLTTSLAYLPLLQNPTPTSLLTVLQVNNYRPPLLYISTLPFYALFGTNFDSAVYANIGWLVLGLVAIYAVGRQTAGHRVGLLAVGVYLLFPFVHGLARLFYFETALAAFCMLNLATLLASRRFTRRGWAVAWGLTLGLGLLTKWTLPATVGLPILYVLWQSVKENLRIENYDLRLLIRHSQFSILNFQFLGSIALGALLALLLLWPARAVVATTALGNWLYPAFGLTWGGTLFLLMRPPRPLTNLLVGLAITLSVMAFWYYLQPGFIRNFMDAAYLGADGRDTPLSLSNPRTYVYYIRYLATEIIGPVLALLLLPWAVLPFFRGQRDTATIGAELTRQNPNHDAIIMLGLAVVSTYVAFTFASYNSERSMLALLGPLAVLIAVGIVRLPRPAQIMVLSSAVVIGALQWGLMTLPAAAPAWSSLQPPHRWSWLARGEFIQNPVAGASDPAYWIAPDVLATILATEVGETSFGMLVNSEGIHRGPYRYLIASQELPVTLTPLTEKGDSWGEVFAQEWVLTKDGNNGDVEAEGQEALRRIAAGDELFHLLYAPVRSYALPQGETATLYHRAEGPAFPGSAPDWEATTQPLVQAINTGWREGGQLLLPDADTAVWLANAGLQATHVNWIAGTPPDSTASVLFVVVSPTQDPRSVFDTAFYPATTLDAPRASLLIYGQPQIPLQRHTGATAAWDTVTLTELRTLTPTIGGQVVPLELDFVNNSAVPLNISLRLLDRSGAVVAQNDRTLSATVRAGLFVPPQTAAGMYTLAIIIYDPTTFAPLRDVSGVEMRVLIDVTITQ